MYLIFSGMVYYPSGGMGDFKGTAFTQQEAEQKCKELLEGDENGWSDDWAHYATPTGEIYCVE